MSWWPDLILSSYPRINLTEVKLPYQMKTAYIEMSVCVFDNPPRRRNGLTKADSNTGKPFLFRQIGTGSERPTESLRIGLGHSLSGIVTLQLACNAIGMRKKGDGIANFE